MIVDEWLDLARDGLRRRALEGAVPVVEGLAGVLRVLRAADWNDALDAPRDAEPPPHASGPATSRG